MSFQTITLTLDFPDVTLKDYYQQQPSTMFEVKYSDTKKSKLLDTPS